MGKQPGTNHSKGSGKILHIVYHYTPRVSRRGPRQHDTSEQTRGKGSNRRTGKRDAKPREIAWPERECHTTTGIMASLSVLFCRTLHANSHTRLVSASLVQMFQVSAFKASFNNIKLMSMFVLFPFNCNMNKKPTECRMQRSAECNEALHEN